MYDSKAKSPERVGLWGFLFLYAGEQSGECYRLLSAKTAPGRICDGLSIVYFLRSKEESV